MAQFENIWVIDFEYVTSPGNNPDPVVCMAAKNLRNDETHVQWLEGVAHPQPPFSLSENDLVIAFFADAEIGSYLALNWELPKNVLDLFVESRNLFNGHYLLSKNRSLLDVAVTLNINGTSAIYKENMRNRILQGPPYTPNEKDKILEYCFKDVLITEQVYRKLEGRLDFPRALLRGWYMITVAIMGRNGVPFDTASFDKLKNEMETGTLQKKIIEDANKQFNVYEGSVFKMEKFARYLNENNIPWPTTPTGLLSTDNDTFKEQAQIYPQMETLRQTLYIMGKLRLKKIPVGCDNRTRTLISPFSSITGRNQPSTNKFIFGPAVWLRGMIKPAEGYGVAYIDYAQQEIGIAAALSKDKNLIHAYNSGDPYLNFGKTSGLIPRDATKISHYIERELLKKVFLATQYGMKEYRFSKFANVSLSKARGLLRNHKKIYKRYWEWSDGNVNTALQNGKIQTCFGWTMLTKHHRESSIRNFFMQAHGAEMLRLAIILVTGKNIKVCAPVHDAILIESPLETLKEDVQNAGDLMTQASSIVLEGFEIRTDAVVVKYPERYSDPRGVEMWEKIGRFIGGWVQ